MQAQASQNSSHRSSRRAQQQVLRNLLSRQVNSHGAGQQLASIMVCMPVQFCCCILFVGGSLVCMMTAEMYSATVCVHLVGG
jgi:hypothetical protein